ncbi:MAG: AmmeMemoRadiSam system protein B [Candidatus Aenigmatarchaeota archaeon]
MNVRKPVVSGTFYCMDPAMLREQVSDLLKHSKTRPEFKAVVCPHAGYMYSGRTAAEAMTGLLPFKKFVVMGPNHTGFGSSFSVMTKGAWRTPLGMVPIDEAAASIGKPLKNDPTGHLQEHSIEVLLPFMQQRFGRFTIIPISILSPGYGKALLEECMALGKALAKLDGFGFVASSDFSHYVPANDAKKKDDAVIRKMLDLDAKGMFRALDEVDASVCGFAPIAVLLTVAKERGWHAKRIHSSDSGDVTGDKKSVVAYHAIGFR